MSNKKTSGHKKNKSKPLPVKKGGRKQPLKNTGPNGTDLQKILDSLKFPFYTIDPADYSVQSLNESAKKKGSDKCYKLWHGRKTPCSGKSYTCPMQQFLKTGRHSVMEHEHVDAKGNKSVIEIAAYPVKDSSGNIVKIVEYGVDIMRRKEIVEELMSSTRQLKKAELEIRKDRD